MLPHLLLLALSAFRAPEPTPTPTPAGIRGYVLRPGDSYDPKSGQYKPLPTRTRLPRPSIEIIKPCRNPPDIAPGSADYRDCDVEVVVGTVKEVDMEARTSSSELSKGWNPMILIEVEDAFPAAVGKTIAVSLAVREQGPSEEPVAPRDRVLVTLLRRPADYSWACGKLQSCVTPPPVNWVGVELYRPAEWP